VNADEETISPVAALAAGLMILSEITEKIKYPSGKSGREIKAFLLGHFFFFLRSGRRPFSCFVGPSSVSLSL
jgi:hypothetical protein